MYIILMYIILMYIIYSFHTLSACSRRPLNFTTLPLYPISSAQVIALRCHHATPIDPMAPWG